MPAPTTGKLDPGSREGDAPVRPQPLPKPDPRSMQLRMRKGLLADGRDRPGEQRES